MFTVGQSPPISRANKRQQQIHQPSIQEVAGNHRLGRFTNETFEFRFECLRRKRDKGNPKLFSQENDMDPGTLPLQLQGLTDIGEMLIARACPIMCVYMGVNGVTEGMF